VRGRRKRSLGLWAIVGLGLGYMTPTVLFDTFGIVTKQTHGVVPLAYLVALVVMIFTAISYGRMAKLFPTAGSSYTYAREAIHPKVGFLVGWAALLDYLLLPLVNAVIIRLYMVSLFPSVPGWIWVVAFVAFITGLNVWSLNSTAKVNFTLVVFAVVMIVGLHRAGHHPAVPRHGHRHPVLGRPVLPLRHRPDRRADGRDRGLLLLHRL
jgi:putrescine importer